HEDGHLLAYILMGVTTLVGVAGWLTAHYFYKLKPEQPDLLMNRMKGAYTLILNKYWVDEAYDKAFVEPGKAVGRGFDRADTAGIDRVVVAVEQATDLSAAGSTWVEKHVIYSGLNAIGYGNHLAARVLRRLQTGLVHHYAAILVAGLVVLVNLIVLFLWLGGAS
ncbi:MAG: NADH-quinone oxidoreductase subunit L, partial [Nitrospirota bacterium]